MIDDDEDTPISTPDASRVEHAGLGRVLMGFTVNEMHHLLNHIIDKRLRRRVITAMGLLDAEAAREYEP